MNWRPPSLSELTTMIFDIKLTHLGLKASNHKYFKLTGLNIFDESISFVFCKSIGVSITKKVS